MAVDRRVNASPLDFVNRAGDAHAMRRLLAFFVGIVGVISLAACGGSSSGAAMTFLEACEHATLGVITSPSSYQRVADQNPSVGLVYVQYDSLNSFGAVIRGYSRCRFGEREDGAPHLTEFSVNGNDDPVLLILGQEAIDLQ